jgi:predicted dehydrogenase/nucleoside-diphosphate-sugar epimerase
MLLKVLTNSGVDLLSSSSLDGPAVRRVALVGAGNISEVHSEVLMKLPGVKICAVVDTNNEAAQTLAERCGGVTCFETLDEAIASKTFDVAHVLTPPSTHWNIANRLLEVGLDVLLEKPMAVSTDECDLLLKAASQSGAKIGVNQNFVFDAAFSKLVDFIESGRAGKLNSVTCIYSMPLRQLSGGQFGHWMFRQPRNLLLEQAIHPLSQILTLIGSIEDANVSVSDIEMLTPDTPFCSTLLAHLNGEKGHAQFEFKMGAEFPTWQIVACCDDATLIADMITGHFTVQSRTRWLEPIDDCFNGLRQSVGHARHAIFGLSRYALAMLKITQRSDSFYQSMSCSIRSFYKGLGNEGGPLLDGVFGRELVFLCEKLADKAGWPEAVKMERRDVAPGYFDVLVIGGTGFIGKHVVSKLRKKNFKVGVMARSVSGLDETLLADGIEIVRGDIKEQQDVEKAIGKAKVVINLAHGGGGRNWVEIREAMVGGAMKVAEACSSKSVEHLIHIGSIAGLNLGDAKKTVSAETVPDEQLAMRAEYARAKAETDIELMEWAYKANTKVTIVRPGVVVGFGGSAFHTGVGFFNNDQHALGWNMGYNKLPFVLVEDVADGIVKCVKNETAYGKAYNFVGDVRMTSREYTSRLASALGRPLKFHPQPTMVLFAQEMGKWGIKFLAGKRQPRPTLYDLKSRGMVSQFNCFIEKRDLDWQPESDLEIFLDRGLRVHK